MLTANLWEPPFSNPPFARTYCNCKFELFDCNFVIVPGYFVYYLLTTEGSFVERIKKGITPIIEPRADAVIAMEKLRLKEQGLDAEAELGLVDNSDSDIVRSNHA